MEIDPDAAECLPLTLVDGQGKGRAHRELLAGKEDGDGAVIRRRQRDPRDQHFLAKVLVRSSHDPGLDEVLHHVNHDQPRAVGQALVKVQVSKENDWHTLFQG